jgi:hypothetical protein
MQRECIQCGKTFDAPRSKVCSQVCRQRQTRGASPTTPSSIAIDAAVAAKVGIVSAVMTELEAAGKIGSSLGQAAIRLAVRLETSETDTGAGLASLSKELRAVMTQLTAAAPAVTDQLDELRSRRDSKRAASR